MVNNGLYFFRILLCIGMADNSKGSSPDYFFFIINIRANFKTAHFEVCAYLSLVAGGASDGTSRYRRGSDFGTQ